MADTKTYKTLGGQAVVWGTGEVADIANCGTILDASGSTSASEEPIDNGDGAKTGTTIYDEEEVINLTVLADPTKTAVPKIGDIVQIGGTTGPKGYVNATGRTWGNKAHKKITFTAVFPKNFDWTTGPAGNKGKPGKPGLTAPVKTDAEKEGANETK